MRLHFDQTTIIRAINFRKNDYDIVYSHLPEHTHQLVNTLYNLTHHVPKVIGYSHWFDFDHVVVWSKDSIKQNMFG